MAGGRFEFYAKTTMALIAYLDDSGTDSADPCLIAGGFAAGVDQWDKFIEEVQVLDSEFQAPPFHAQHFEKARHGHGDYAGWPEEKRHDYLNRFLGIIGRRCFKSFAVSLDKRAYENTARPQLAFQEYFYSPFVFTAVNAVNAVCEWPRWSSRNSADESTSALQPLDVRMRSAELRLWRSHLLGQARFTPPLSVVLKLLKR